MRSFLHLWWYLFSLKAIKSKSIWRRLCVFISFFCIFSVGIKTFPQEQMHIPSLIKDENDIRTQPPLPPSACTPSWRFYFDLYIRSLARGGGVAVVHIHPQPLQQPHNTCIVRWITMCWHIHFHISTRDEVKDRETWHFIFKKLLIGKRGGQMMDE